MSGIMCGDDGFAQLDTACAALLGNGADVDASCGTHVHIGCKDLTPLELVYVAKFYDAHHSIIDMLHAPSRRGRTTWSGEHIPSYVEQLAKSAAVDDAGTLRMMMDERHRYRSVNLTSFHKYGTIEFRQHGGSLNSAKLGAWIRFLMALIDAAKDGAERVGTLGELLAVLGRYGLSAADAGYLTERASSLR